MPQNGVSLVFLFFGRNINIAKQKQRRKYEKKKCVGVLFQVLVVWVLEILAGISLAQVRNFLPNVDFVFNLGCLSSSNNKKTCEGSPHHFTLYVAWRPNVSETCWTF